MKITLVTVTIAVLAVIEVARTLLRLKRDRMGIRSGLIWLVMWSSIGFFSIFPEPLDTVMAIGQMQNRLSFVLLVAVVILFTLVFGLTTRLERLQREVARVVQELALSNYRNREFGEQTGADEP